MTALQGTLHIVASSPFESNALVSAIKTASIDDAILLIQNGVYAAMETPVIDDILAMAPPGLMIFALAEDLDARALPAVRAHVNTVNYAGFVDLVCQFHNSVSWN